MTTAVYLRRLEPTLYEVNGSESVGPEDNFHVQMTARLARVVGLLNRTRLVYRNAGIVAKGGVHTVVGITYTQDPYLFSVLGHARNEVGGVELGIFSSDSDFVNGVRTRMETNLPSWIEAGDPRGLELWQMEGVYALISKHRALIR